MTDLRTDRLTLRPWRDSDVAPWAAMNADPEVREHLGGPLTPEQSAQSIAGFRSDLDERGWGWWAVEVRETGEFIGFAGLDPVDEDMPFTGIEAGWRLARQAWGHGYATEAARAVVTHGFDRLGLPEILAVTTVGNIRSQAVMRRIGMTQDETAVPEGPLTGNVVFRLTAGTYALRRRSGTPSPSGV